MNLEELEKLSELKEKGIITEEEFLEQKKKLLNDESKDETQVSNKNEVKGKDNIVINNNVTVDTGKKGKKVGFLTILGYIVGIPLLLSSIVNIFSGQALSGIFGILAGLAIVPLFNDLLEKKFNFKLSRVLRIILFIVFFSMCTSTLTSKEKANPSHVESADGAVVAGSEAKNEIKEIKINDKIVTDEWEVTLLEASVKDNWKIEHENMFLSSSFKAEEGKTYVVSKVSVKNLGKESKNFGNSGFIVDNCKSEAICNSDYKYDMTFRAKDDSISTGYTSIEPLETEVAYIYKEVPTEAVTNSIKIKYNVVGSEYLYTLK